MNPFRPTLGLASSLKTLRFPRPNQLGQLKPYHTTQFAHLKTPTISWSRRLTAVGLGSVVGLSLFSLSPGKQSFSPVRIAECECTSHPGYPSESDLSVKSNVVSDHGLSNTAYPIRADPAADDLPSQSILSPYQLSFGAVCGVCAGIFVKKGAKLVAFTFGAVYVLMQVSSACSCHPCHPVMLRPNIVSYPRTFTAGARIVHVIPLDHQHQLEQARIPIRRPLWQ